MNAKAEVLTVQIKRANSETWVWWDGETPPASPGDIVRIYKDGRPELTYRVDGGMARNVRWGQA